MLVLGIESSCDETGVALYDTEFGLLSHTLHSQVAHFSAFRVAGLENHLHHVPPSVGFGLNTYEEYEPTTS